MSLQKLLTEITEEFLGAWKGERHREGRKKGTSNSHILDVLSISICVSA